MRLWLLWAIAGAIALLALAAALIHWLPSVGAEPSGERLSRMRGSPRWSEGRFKNEQPMWTNTRSGLLRVFESTPGDSPDAPVPVKYGGEALRVPAASGLRVTWFGHSSVLIEIDGSDGADRSPLERASVAAELGRAQTVVSLARCIERAAEDRRRRDFP